MAVLKGIIGAVVVSIEGRKSLYKEQRRVLKRLATALWEQPDELDAMHAEDFAAAETDAARRRVIVDQVASLTDQHAIAWHGRLVGEVDAAVHRRLGARRIAPGPRAASSVEGADGRAHPCRPTSTRSRRAPNIADIIGERVALKTAGVGAMKGLCPFHDERSPSFNVRPQAGFYHCFGCGESGDVYSFLRAMDHVSFTEAVERLAGRIGYTLHYEDGGAAPETTGRARLYAANARGRGVLPRAARDRRGRHRATIPRGARASMPAPPRTSASATRPRAGRTCATRCTGRASPTRSSSAAGLVSQGQRGVYDRFRGRAIWPIRDVTGQVIGFGARRLYDDDKGPKYLNTPETTVYHKAQVLYGLDLAKRDISRDHRVVVVEGYTDVMACHLAGITTAIATCGTAFGSDHITVLRRVMGDDSAARRGGLHLRPGCRGPEGGAARLRRRQAVQRADLRRRRAGGTRPVRPAPAARRRRRPRAHGHQGADGRVRHRSADRRASTCPPSRAASARCAPRRRSSPRSAIRSLQPEYVRVLARRLGLDPEEVRREVERAARSASRARGSDRPHPATARARRPRRPSA